MKSPSLERLGQLLAISLVASLALWVAFSHARIVANPWPLSSVEGPMMASTDLIVHGQNPYGFESRPQAANVYGGLYPLAVAPLVMAFHSQSLLIYRSVSAAFLLLCLGLVYLSCRRSGSGALAAAFVSANIYATQLYLMHTLARSDTLGEFLFLASVFSALYAGQRRAWLALSGFLGCAAYYAKPYFLVAVPIVCLWLLWRRRFAAALAYAAGSAALAALSVALLSHFAPAYFYETFYMQSIGCDYSFNYMLGQIPWLFRYQPGLPVALCLALYFRPAPATLGDEQGAAAAEAREGLWFFSFLGFLTFVFVLGGNQQNIGAYLVDLVLPFLLPALATRLRGRWLGALAAILVAANVGLALQETPSLHGQVEAKVNQNWQFLEGLIDRCRPVCASPDFTPLMIEKGLPYGDDGHGWMYSILARPKAAFLASCFPRREEALARLAAFNQQTRAGILKKKYFMVLACSNDNPPWRDALQKNYKPMGALFLEFYGSGARHIEIWIVKNPGRRASEKPRK